MTQPRKFELKSAAREKVPLLVGLYGPSGCGKTYSALRLATGIQRVTGGDIIGIDTESKRMLHYADRFKFKHLEFGAPFNPLSYLEAVHYCVKQGAGVIIVDSQSHEHEGEGGVLDMHETELDRLAGSDERKRFAMNLLAWARPKAERRKFLNALLQVPCNFVFCFRAKEKVKPKKKGEQGEAIIQLGWMPIAGEEFIYEMTLNALLLPGSRGVPSWHGAEIGENAMIKLPEQFRDLFAKPRPFDEAIGESLANWANGDARPAAKPLADRIAKAIGFFVGKGASQQAILAALKAENLESLDDSHLAQLETFRKALVGRTQTLPELFPPVPITPEPEYGAHELEPESREPGSDDV